MLKKYLFVVFLILNFVIVAGDNSNSKLKIKIQGLKNNSGTVKVALCNSLENYNNHKEPFKGFNLPILNNKAEITLTDLSPGYYAVKVFHDANNNNDLDTNLLGIPIEDYGFSNNANGIFGPPAWNKAKVMIGEGQSEIIINIE